jgi:hypothetical protein
VNVVFSGCMLEESEVEGTPRGSNSISTVFLYVVCWPILFRAMLHDCLKIVTRHFKGVAYAEKEKTRI